MRILKYEILSRHGSDSHTDLIEVVNEYVDNGWQPLGGVSLSYSNFAPHLAQAMAYYEEAKDANIEYEVKKECEHFWGVAVHANTKERHSICLKCGETPISTEPVECEHIWKAVASVNGKQAWAVCEKCSQEKDISVVLASESILSKCYHRLAVGVNRRNEIIYLFSSTQLAESNINQNDIFKFCPDCGKCLIDVYGNRE